MRPTRLEAVTTPKAPGPARAVPPARGKAQPGGLRVGPADDRFEREADRVARLAAGRPTDAASWSAVPCVGGPAVGVARGSSTTASGAEVFTSRGLRGPVVQRMLTDAGIIGYPGHLYDNRNTTVLFQSLEDGWLLIGETDWRVRYKEDTAQYSTETGQWWDPVTDRLFDAYDNSGWYHTGDDYVWYYYDAAQGQYVPHVSTPPQGPQAVGSVPVDLSAEAAWLTENLADSRGRAVQLITAGRFTDKVQAWTMFDYWNAVHADQTISHQEVGLDPENRLADLSPQETPAAREFTRPSFTSKSYARRVQPKAGDVIDLPSPEEVASNLDYYMRGKESEIGGDAAALKAEKHDITAPDAIAFARQPGRRWFIQKTEQNHVIFHDFQPNVDRTFTMVVWDWTKGKLVTFYTINANVPGGVRAYLQGKGMR